MTIPVEPLHEFAAALDGKRIFVTGGTGFFGRSLLDLLGQGACPGAQWHLLSRDPEAFRRRCPWADLPQVHLIRGEVRDFVFPECYFDLIWHGAAPAVTDLPPGEMRSIIEDGTRRVLELAKYSGAGRMLFISSGAVYGRQPADLAKIPEDFAGQPVTEYGVAKRAAEQFCRESGVPVVIARCFAFIGRHLNREIHFAVGNFLRDALAGQPVRMQGDGTPLRSYLYADDLVEWLLAALLRGRPGEAYNIGSEDALSIRDLAERIAVLLGCGQVTAGRAAVPGKPAERYIPAIGKAQRELGVKVRVPLDQAIRLSAQ